MLRSTLLYLSNRPRIFRFVRDNRLAKRFAKRFVAGETLDEAVSAVAALNARGITASLDLLGESVTNEREARAAGAQYLGVLDRIQEKKLDANVSLKLTAMGLDISEELCISVMHDVLDRARELSTFVRLDMEGSAYTERTLNLFADRLYPALQGSRRDRAPELPVPDAVRRGTRRAARLPRAPVQGGVQGAGVRGVS